MDDGTFGRARPPRVSRPAGGAAPQPLLIGDLDVRVLGQVRVGNGPPLRGRLGCLTTLLALSAPRPVALDELLRWVFVDRPDGAHHGELHPLVSRLRRRLRDERLTVELHHGRAGYALVGARTDLDAVASGLATAAAIERDDPERAMVLATAALALCGPVAELPDGHPGWGRVAPLERSAVELQLRCGLELGRHHSVVGPLLTACARWPFDEELHRLAMVALYRCGRQVEALALYQDLRVRLDEELGLEPGADLRRTELLVLRHDLDAPHSMPRSGPTPLPHYRDRYVENPGTAAALTRALEHTGVVTITGTAGVGKTRLVVETVPGLAARWPDGVVFCELSQVETPAGVPGAIAAAAAVRVPAGTEAVDALVDAWRDGRRLLVLDTCEHLIDAVAAVVTDLSTRCPTLTVAATSRAPLHVPGERICTVTTLDGTTAAVRLFVERARQADADFAPAAAEEVVVGELCARLDGLPLAIELAAARIGTFTPAELLARLDDRLRLLEAGGPGRHGSLRAALDWSLRSLDERHQRAFCLLGTFVTAVDLELVERMLGDPDGADDHGAALLATLVDRSLVVARRTPDGTRYRLLDSVRALARELLEAAGERDAAFARHAAIVATRKDALVAAGEGPDDVRAMAALAELWPEVRSAVAWTTETGEVDLACGLVTGLGAAALCQERSEVFGWVAATLQLAERATVPPARLAEVAAAGVLAGWMLGRAQEVAAWAQRIEDAVRAGAVRSTTDVVMSGPFHATMVAPASYADCCERAALLARSAGNRYGECWALNGAAMGHAYEGRSVEALEATERSGRLVEHLGSSTQEALRQFARTIALLDHDPATALDAADATLVAAARVGVTWLDGTTPNYRAAALVRAGDVDAAVGEVTATLDRLATGAPIQSVANTVRNAIALLDRLGRAEAAAPLVGWYASRPAIIPGTPGMRAHVDDLRARLPALVEPGRLAVLLAEGESLEIDEVLSISRRALR